MNRCHKHAENNLTY